MPMPTPLVPMDQDAGIVLIILHRKRCRQHVILGAKLSPIFPFIAGYLLKSRHNLWTFEPRRSRGSPGSRRGLPRVCAYLPRYIRASTDHRRHFLVIYLGIQGWHWAVVQCEVCSVRNVAAGETCLLVAILRPPTGIASPLRLETA